MPISVMLDKAASRHKSGGNPRPISKVGSIAAEALANDAQAMLAAGK